MRGDAGEGEKIVEREIAIAYGVEAIGGDPGEAEFTRNGDAIYREGITSKCARTHGTSVGSDCGVLQSCYVACKGFGMCEQEMREQDRLCVLHVGHAGHGYAKFGSGLRKQCIDEREQATL